MLQALLVSLRSKDPNTKVGCVIVDQNNHQLTMGYNGFPAGINETKLTWNNSKESPYEDRKYGYVVHSEANAILHANNNLKGSRIYVTLFPCEECSKMLITKGIKEVIYLSDKNKGAPSNKIAKKLLRLAKVKCRQYNPSKSALANIHNLAFSVRRYNK
jgi:dCMP deaminase